MSSFFCCSGGLDPGFQYVGELPENFQCPKCQEEKRKRSLLAKEIAKELAKCDELFTKIRNDWTDPREECRAGWNIIEGAQETIGAALSSLPTAQDKR